MRKLMLLLLAGCAIGGGYWALYGVPERASSQVLRPEILQTVLGHDPARSAIESMPDGSRFIAVAEKAETTQDFTATIDSLQAEADQVSAAVRAIQALHKSVLASCSTDVGALIPILATANENGERLRSTLVEADRWIQRVASHVENERAVDVTSSTALRHAFQHKRVEIEQSIDTIKTLANAIPRLQKSICQPLKIPPFRESNR